MSFSHDEFNDGRHSEVQPLRRKNVEIIHGDSLSKHKKILPITFLGKAFAHTVEL